MDEFVIQKSKSKLVPLGVLAALFLLLGVTMLGSPELFVGPLWNRLNLIRMLGGLSFVFFWVTIFIGVRILTDHTPGLTLDLQGFTSQTGFVHNRDNSAGEKISWQNIRHIQEFQLRSERLIEIEFSENESDTSRTGEPNNSSDLPEIFSGPPFLLSSKDLNIKFDELLTQFNKYHQAARTRSSLKP